MHNFKERTATGPDGWARIDLACLPVEAVRDILGLLQGVEEGLDWPLQFRCLEKAPGSTTVNGYRPITLFSTIYRLWSGHRARQLLAYLSKFGDELQCGYAADHEASDIWYHVQTLIKFQFLSNSEIHCAVGDLVKAFNLLPRVPVFHAISLLGLPKHFLNCWQRFQAELGRRVRDSCCPPLFSVTGFAEGCPLSCVAMFAVDVIWHCYQRQYSHISRPLSYVDNLRS